MKAFKNPESIEMIVALYDRGLRWRAAGVNRDLCWQDFTRITQLAKEPFFEAYCASPEIDKEERAQMRHRMAIVAFEAGDHDTVNDIAQKTLDLGPQGITRWQALYTQAYHHSHCGHDDHALQMYREILDEHPLDQELVPNIYMEMAKAHERKRDFLAVLLTAEEFCILYPYRTEARELKTTQYRMLLRGGALRSDFNKARETLLDRLRSKSPPVSLTSKNSVPSEIKITTLAMEAAK